MEPYKIYKDQLENRFNKDMKDILIDYYIIQALGPSVGAKKLGIPREAFIHYRNLYKLEEIKHTYAQQKAILPEK